MSDSPAVDSPVVAALQAALAAEHAATWVLQVLAARSAPDTALRGVLEVAVADHLGRRDHLATAVAARGAAPVGPAAVYDLPTPLVAPADLRAAGAAVETALAPAYAGLVAATASSDRRWALGAWRDVALAAVRLGAAPAVTPGI